MTEQEQKDVAIVLAGFERSVFVRNIEGDGKPGWLIRAVPYIAALARLQRAVNTTDALLSISEGQMGLR